jgi:toxin-antitoxin system PIN domain toxin
VFLCDSNVWLALALSKHVHHRAARAWLETISDPDSILFCRATQQSFLRLLTNASVLGLYGNPPLTNRQAWKAFDALMADDRIVLRTEEPPGLSERWKKFSLRDEASPKLWMDAYLAAFAAAGRHQMVTTDSAYRQFSGLALEILGLQEHRT